MCHVSSIRFDRCTCCTACDYTDNDSESCTRCRVHFDCTSSRIIRLKPNAFCRRTVFVLRRRLWSRWTFEGVGYLRTLGFFFYAVGTQTIKNSNTGHVRVFGETKTSVSPVVLNARREGTDILFKYTTFLPSLFIPKVYILHQYFFVHC